MDNKNPDFQPSNTSQSFEEHLDSRAQKVLQPTETIIKEQNELPKAPADQAIKVNLPDIPEPPHKNISLPTNIYPEVAEHTNPNAPTSIQEKKDLNKNKKVSDYATSLKLYAYLIIIFESLSILWVFTTFGKLVSSHAISGRYLTTMLVRTIMTALPIIIGSILLLVTKNKTLVKAILIIILLIYCISLISYALILLSFHQVNNALNIVLAIIPIIFIIWTCSVLSEVRNISD